MSEPTDLDHLYLDAPASHLLNDTEAAMFKRLQTDWQHELRQRFVRATDRHVRETPLPDTEALLTEVVEEVIGDLCGAGTQVEIGGGSVTMTLDLIEVDVRAQLLAAALLSDDFEVPRVN